MSRFVAATSALLVLPLSACIGFDFTDRSDVTYARILAIQIDPPVFRAGDEVTARALAVRPDGSHLVPDGTPFTNDVGERACDGNVCFDWSFCLRPERTPGLDSIQYNPEVASQGCENAQLGMQAGGNPFLTVNPDGSLSIDTTLVAGMIDTGMLAPIATALGVPESVVERVLRDIGIAVVVELRVFDGPDVFVGYKRALFIDDGCMENCLGQNPPAPQLEFRRRDDPDAAFWVTGRGVSEEFQCRACERDESDPLTCISTGEPIRLEPGAAYVLAPEEDTEEDTPRWAEPYTILSLSGEFLETRETGYFSFFTTGGSLQEEKTRYPAAEEIFTAPSDPGSYALWIIVRDGHYGQDACRIDFELL